MKQDERHNMYMSEIDVEKTRTHDVTVIRFETGSQSFTPFAKPKYSFEYLISVTQKLIFFTRIYSNQREKRANHVYIQSLSKTCI